VRIEELGVPGVLAIARGFEDDANSAADVNGMPVLRMVVVPGYIWGRQPREAKKPLAEAAFDELVEALLRPPAVEEMKPDQKEGRSAPIEVVSESYEAAVEDFNQLFLNNRWGDGLPLIPPTAERVKWMLSGTTRSPDEAIGTVAPGRGVATVEKVAVNAVMAGAKPEYLPVIIAAMEGLTDEDFDVLHMQASTGNFTLAIILTGPLGKEINMNSGIGYLGHGWRANSTIGRAVRLCLLNACAFSILVTCGRASATWRTWAGLRLTPSIPSPKTPIFLRGRPTTPVKDSRQTKAASLSPLLAVTVASACSTSSVGAPTRFFATSSGALARVEKYSPCSSAARLTLTPTGQSTS